MAQNPLGAVVIYDFGAPRIISGRAREAISGGQLVFTSGAAGVVSSGANSFDPKTDLLFATGASGAAFTGIALANAGSNESLSVAIDGVFSLSADGTVTAANPVIVGGNDAVATGVTAGQVIGRALSSATSGNYALVHIQH